GQRFSFTYDNNGNTKTKNDALKNLTKTMVYDHANRITKVKDQTGKVRGQYKYDDQGVRVRKIVEKDINGQNRRIVMSTHNKYFATEKLQTPDGWDVPGTDIAINNVYLNGIRIASMDSNGQAAYYLANHVDSVKVVADDTGKALSRTEYLPYGETFQQEGDIKFTPKYNGQALDEESDLYYYNARHYDPEIGRFVTADTVTDGPMTMKGWNRYMYVGGNPIMYKDPTGHEGKKGKNPIAQNDVQELKDYATEKGMTWNDNGVMIIGLQNDNQESNKTTHNDIFILVVNNKIVGVFAGSTTPGKNSDTWVGDKGVGRILLGEYKFKYQTKEARDKLRADSYDVSDKHNDVLQPVGYKAYGLRDENKNGFIDTEEKFFVSKITGVLFHSGGLANKKVGRMSLSCQVIARDVAYIPGTYSYTGTTGTLKKYKNTLYNTTNRNRQGAYNFFINSVKKGLKETNTDEVTYLLLNAGASRTTKSLYRKYAKELGL
ncbi:MAG: RHS repeat-associated core domain-containing protein, partial [Leptospirales bacterium]